MSDKITQIQLPNGTIYDLSDQNVGIDSDYISADYEVVLTVGSLGDADSTEY